MRWGLDDIFNCNFINKFFCCWWYCFSVSQKFITICPINNELALVPDDEKVPSSSLGDLSQKWPGSLNHDDVIKRKHFSRYWPFVRGIHRSPVNSPHKGQCRRTLMFPLICAWINGGVNNREAGDLRHHRAHYDVIVMASPSLNISYREDQEPVYFLHPECYPRENRASQQ